jgi:hypothetical protein
MSTLNRLLVVGLALAGLASAVRADTVVLTSGARLSGEVSNVRNGVAIRSRDGTVTIPSWRIARIYRGDEAAEPQEAGSAGPAAVPSPAPAPPAAPTAQPAPGSAAVAAPAPPRPPLLADVLTRKMDVNFDGIPVYDAVAYIRERTGVNMAIAPEVRTAQTSVYLTVRDVPLYTILNEMLEPANLSYGARPGETLYIGPRGASRPVMRVYPVTDLLLSTEDRNGGIGNNTGGSGTQGGIGTNRGGGTGNTFSSPQFGQSSSGSQVSNARGGTASTLFSPLSSRAENLILLIKSGCGGGSWADPYSSGLIDSAQGQLSAATQGTPVQPGF